MSVRDIVDLTTTWDALNRPRRHLIVGDRVIVRWQDRTKWTNYKATVTEFAKNGNPTVVFDIDGTYADNVKLSRIRLLDNETPKKKSKVADEQKSTNEMETEENPENTAAEEKKSSTSRLKIEEKSSDDAMTRRRKMRCINENGVAFRERPNDWSPSNKIEGVDGPAFLEVVDVIEERGEWFSVRCDSSSSIRWLPMRHDVHGNLFEIVHGDVIVESSSTPGDQSETKASDDDESTSSQDDAKVVVCIPPPEDDVDETSNAKEIASKSNKDSEKDEVTQLDVNDNAREYATLIKDKYVRISVHGLQVYDFDDAGGRFRYASVYREKENVGQRRIVIEYYSSKESKVCDFEGFEGAPYSLETSGEDGSFNGDNGTLKDNDGCVIRTRFFPDGKEEIIDWEMAVETGCAIKAKNDETIAMISKAHSIDRKELLRLNIYFYDGLSANARLKQDTLIALSNSLPMKLVDKEDSGDEKRSGGTMSPKRRNARGKSNAREQSQWFEGEDVEVHWPKNGKWFPAKITSVETSGRLNVYYTLTNEFEENVDPERLRRDKCGYVKDDGIFSSEDDSDSIDEQQSKRASSVDERSTRDVRSKRKKRARSVLADATKALKKRKLKSKIEDPKAKSAEIVRNIVKSQREMKRIRAKSASRKAASSTRRRKRQIKKKKKNRKDELETLFEKNKNVGPAKVEASTTTCPICNTKVRESARWCPNPNCKYELREKRSIGVLSTNFVSTSRRSIRPSLDGSSMRSMHSDRRTYGARARQESQPKMVSSWTSGSHRRLSNASSSTSRPTAQKEEKKTALGVMISVDQRGMSGMIRSVAVHPRIFNFTFRNASRAEAPERWVRGTVVFFDYVERTRIVTGVRAWAIENET